LALQLFACLNYCIFGAANDSQAPAGRSGYTQFKKAKTNISMARKKKAKRFRAVTAVKELARERLGAPPAGQVVVERKKKPEKYKPTLGKLLEPE
jgi:hypothetical protein